MPRVEALEELRLRRDDRPLAHRARAAEALGVALEEHRVVAARRLAHEGLGGGEELEQALHQAGAEAWAWLLEGSERQALPEGGQRQRSRR